jgi:hypothetical protein
MTDIYPPAKQREALLKLVEALGCRDNALRRDECSDSRINGKQGWIYAVPKGFQLFFFAREGVNEWDGAGPHIEDYVRAKLALDRRRDFHARPAADQGGGRDDPRHPCRL